MNAAAAQEATPAAKEQGQEQSASVVRGETPIEFIKDVSLEIAVELGRTDLPIQRLLKLKKGSVIEMEKLSEEPLDIRVNGKLVARGEAVIVNEMFGIRVTQIVSPEGEEVF
ncbi:MAG: flagellar motor switch protein FliN [Bdellovibrionales bacterium]|nr:flagellar motor switch protein FliN [Bdellovibrionales bacterium]